MGGGSRCEGGGSELELLGRSRVTLAEQRGSPEWAVGVASSCEGIRGSGEACAAAAAPNGAERAGLWSRGRGPDHSQARRRSSGERVEADGETRVRWQAICGGRSASKAAGR